ncbi:hypothetical protein CAMSH0001_1854 [Campylobacter showae RM3277]|uniref:Uncharacterized protein n=1 Tax=Campylobacter showae RM3277 TaxID=553219 RepID=C6RDD8_9BACT|nr:hypothetical protein CAMSH0001_1854 [Campylobacter showae RM3277]
MSRKSGIVVKSVYHINPLKRVLNYIGKFEKKFRVKIRKAIKFNPVSRAKFYPNLTDC